jgi:hypothetical protein
VPSYTRFVRGARITITCDCGRIGYIDYGARWTCGDCDRLWNTAQIPASEYWGIMREMRRYRVTAVGAALVLCVTFGLLAFLVAQRLFLLFPVVMAGWYLLYMPQWRRRVRQRARNLPNWQLHPE